MTNDQINIVREALTGGHTGDLSAEGQRKYLAALDIIERSQSQMGLLLEARNALAQTFPFDTGGIAALMTRIDAAIGGVAPARRFTGVGHLEETGYIPAGSAAEREGNAGVQASAAPSNEWAEVERLRDLPEVDEALLNFKDDCTGDNAAMVVRAVRRAVLACGAQERVTPAHTCANAGTSAGACKAHCGDKVRCWGTEP